MRRLFGRWLLVVGTFASFVAIPSVSEAQLFPRLYRRRAQRLGYHPGCATPGGATTAYMPVAATAYYGGGLGSRRPTTAYRTVWAPVPVTSYRPVYGGQQACTSYTWQARRVPYVAAYQPSFVAPVVSTPTYRPTISYSPAVPSVASNWQPASIASAPQCSSCSVASVGTTAQYGSTAGSDWRPVSTAAPNASSCSSCSTTSSAPTTQTPPAGSSDWRPVHPTVNSKAAPVPADSPPLLDPISTPTESGYNPSSTPAGATDWRPVTESDADSSQPPKTKTPADEPPRLEGSGSRTNDGAAHHDSGFWRPNLEQVAESNAGPRDRSRQARNEDREFRVGDQRDYSRSDYYRGVNQQGDDLDPVPSPSFRVPQLLQPIPDSHREARRAVTRTASLDRWEAVPVARHANFVRETQSRNPSMQKPDADYEGWHTIENARAQ